MDKLQTYMEKNTKIIISAVIVILLVGGFVVYEYKTTKGKEGAYQASPTGNASSTPISVDPYAVGQHDGYTVEEVASTSTKPTVTFGLPPAPNFEKAVVYPSDLSPEAVSILKSRFAATVASLKKNVHDYNLWLDLAVERKIVRDYVGAAQAYEYAGKISPGSDVPFLSLGDIYHHFVVDYKKSEDSFFAALKINPKNTIGYRGLYDLYTYSYKTNTSAARDVLITGVGVNPDAVDLIVLLARYYRDHGDKANAKIYYDKALALPAVKNDASSKAALESEKNAL